MKKQAVLLFVIGLLCLIGSTFFLSCDSCNPPKTCNLPAPEVVTGTPTGPTTALLDWDDVAGASGYSIAVIDTTTSTPLGSFDTTASQLLLTGLVPGHFYKASVRAKCEDGIPSVNARLGSWEQGFVVIEDADVMMPGGCGCNDVTFASTYSSKTSSLTNNDAFSLGSADRVVYKLQFSKTVNSNVQVSHIAIAVDYDCDIVKVNRKGVCPNDANFTYELDPSTDPTAVLLKDAGNLIATIKPIYLQSTLGSGQLEIAFDIGSRNNASSPEYTVKLNKCITSRGVCP